MILNVFYLQMNVFNIYDLYYISKINRSRNRFKIRFEVIVEKVNVQTCQQYHKIHNRNVLHKISHYLWTYVQNNPV